MPSTFVARNRQLLPIFIDRRCTAQVVNTSLSSGFADADAMRMSNDRRLPHLADAVEKVCGILLTCNNRIIGVDFLNRTCAFDAVFESILLREPPKIFFRQHRPKAAGLTGLLPW